MIDICLSPDNIYVVEINGWKDDTDAAMFSWNEEILSSDIWDKQIEICHTMMDILTNGRTLYNCIN